MGPQQDPNDPPRGTTYFAADDAAATAGAHQGRRRHGSLELMEVGPMGTMVVALDPQGNPSRPLAVGLSTQASRSTTSPAPWPGTRRWSTTTAAAKRFYYGCLRVQLRPDGRRDGRRGHGLRHLQDRGGTCCAVSAASDPSIAEGLADLLRRELHRQAVADGRGEAAARSPCRRWTPRSAGSPSSRTLGGSRSRSWARPPASLLLAGGVAALGGGPGFAAERPVVKGAQWVRSTSEL